MRATDRQHLLLPTHANPQPSRQIVLDTIVRCVHNDHAAMHLRESLRIEPLRQRLQRRTNHEPFAGRDDFRVHLRRLEIRHIVDRYESRRIFHTHSQPSTRGATGPRITAARRKPCRLPARRMSTPIRRIDHDAQARGQRGRALDASCERGGRRLTVFGRSAMTVGNARRLVVGRIGIGRIEAACHARSFAPVLLSQSRHAASLRLHVPVAAPLPRSGRA